MNEISWLSYSVEYKIKKPLPSEETSEHPLKPSVIIPIFDGKYGAKRGIFRSTSTSTSNSTPTPTHTPVNAGLALCDPLSEAASVFDGTDPLSQFAREELDPLSKMAADEWDYSSNVVTSKKKSKDNTVDELIEPWSVRRAVILNKYTTSEKLTIVTSFLTGGEKVVKIQPNNLVDKVRNRLEQLDDFEEGSVRQMLDLSQQEYVSRIEQLNNELVQAWHSDQRVKALKIAIQCAKLLVDTSGMAFYPSKFVLITDILDIFGKLVYDRLKMKADYYKPGSKIPTNLPDNFTPDMVPENAKETCRNWFYKIASIRELVPRLYVEMAIIKSYSFLTTNEFNIALLRITKMIRGIGNPLIAVYARCYLCRVGLALKTTDLEFVRENLYDFLLTYHQLFSQSMKAELARQNISFFVYLNLYTPALDWILQVMTKVADENTLTEILTRCKQQNHGALLFNAILTAFKPSYVASRAMEFVHLITDCSDDTAFPQYILYRNLGERLVQEEMPREDCQAIFEIVWKYIISLQDPIKFMHCAETWIQFVVMHFSTTELNEFLREIINHLSPDRSFENYYLQLQAIIEKIVSKTQDFESLLTMENFLPLIDLFHKESVKVDVCKIIIEGLSAQSGPITDPIIINALMYISKIMHDSVNALTVDDEKRQIGVLICGLVQRVDYGRDFEKQLNFYADARAAFPNLDSVHVQLVQCVNRQAVETRKIVRGHHTRRTAAFVRACAAFCFITIPSLTLVQTRLQLYLLSGQVALLNQCLGQADACFKAALNLVPEMPKTIEIDVPDSPEHGVLYLIRGLLNAVQRFFDENSSVKCTLYLRVLDLLSTVTLETYPYHIDKVDSNDKLYGSDEKFISEVNKMCTKILEGILSHLKYLGQSSQYDKQSALSTELFMRLIIRADLRQPSLANMAISLWNLSQKHGYADAKIQMKTLEYIKRKSCSPNFEHLKEIVKKISA
ncbi:VPS35 endosomal protein sorting factor-like isoform X2 [Chelonus insularis]|uniref:VPS35 endosomal protein sorting factor-like isoform X2 n=1 Tax=Chelonus insularis TaxID=460826 RepID=UPI001588BC26|nr:VPS35 endosomal protein sorting factor-like isoform X2 [Chelonus insularis]